MMCWMCGSAHQTIQGTDRHVHSIDMWGKHQQLWLLVTMFVISFQLLMLEHTIAECVKGCTRLRRNWRNICLTMLSIAPTNVLSVRKDLNSLAIWINTCEHIQMRGHSPVRCAANPSSKLVSLNSTCGSTQERSLITAPSAIVLLSKLAS